MVKKLYICLIFAFLSACVVEEPFRQCPLLTIKREDSRLIQKVNYQDDFEVEFKGVEAYCYFDERVKQEKAKITPIFIVHKLRNTDETDIHFSWFTNSIKGPPAYLGKKTYFAETSMPQGMRTKEFRGQEVEVKIPLEMMYDFEVFAGLVVSPQEKKYNQRIFDVDFNYYEDQPIPEPYTVKLKVYPELYYEDGTVAEPEDLKKKHFETKSDCLSCSTD